jgi:regulator of protease activity HflC (stomatin/prohibitin superfamily)
LDKYGAHVINIDMRDFEFSPQYMAAINEKVTQEQKRLAAQNKLGTVQAEQQQKVAIAKAEAEAVEAQADGKAYATVAQAKATAQETTIEAAAKADAIRVQAAALAQNQNILELKRIEVEQTWAGQWNGQLPTNMYGSAPLPLLHLPTDK